MVQFYPNGLKFIFLCFKLIIIHYHTQKQREIKFKPRIKLNHNICTDRNNGFFFIYENEFGFLKALSLISNAHSLLIEIFKLPALFMDTLKSAKLIILREN